MTRPAPILAGVVGSPAAHSLSPLIHTIWAQRAGIDGYYLPIEAPPTYDAFARTMDALRTLGFAGVNVTIPHKEHALRYADSAEPFAERVGAANMLTFRGGVAHAGNSDGRGFLAALPPASDRKTLKVLVLGGGGAARAVAVACHDLAAQTNKAGVEVTLSNRTFARAEEVAGLVRGSVVSWDDRSSALAGMDILVNTTSLGMTGQPPLLIDLATLPAHAVVFDIVYTPLETGLFAEARQRGNTAINGLDMLMHQAGPGFEAWFGAKPNVDAELRDALVAELTRRKHT